MLSLFKSGVSLARKLDALQNTSPFGVYLSEAEVTSLAKLCTSSSIKAGKGLPESPFYVVIQGEVQVLSEEGETLCTKYPGAFFTRRAGLISKSSIGAKAADLRKSIVKKGDDGKREDDAVTTTVTCKASALVLVLAPSRLNDFLKTLSDESQEVVNAILRTNIGTQLSQVPFIDQADIEPAGLRALGEICSYACYPKDKYVFAQGDTAENFYIILKGTVAITVNYGALQGKESGEEVHAANRSVGDSFGVAALIYNAAARKYSAKATERTLCLVITKANLKKFTSVKPSLEAALMLSTKEFLLKRYAAMNVPIFGHINESMMTRTAELATFSHLEKGEVVYRQGDAPKAFYVVLHGEVSMKTEVLPGPPAGAPGSAPAAASDTSMLHRESKLIADSLMAEPVERLLSVGQHFGEVGVLLPTTPCIATVTATNAVTLLTLKSSDFISLFSTDHNLLSEMQIKLLGKGSTLKSILAHNKARPLFEAHIESEYSGENIKFYDEVSAYLEKAKKGEGDNATLSAEANSLIDMYITDGAELQVNIPSGMQRAIVAWRKSGEPVSAVLPHLTSAQSEIYTLMSRDNYARFVKTPKFEELLVDIGSYDASVASVVNEDDLTMLIQDGEGLAQAHLSA